ncbi:MAG: hypothetical protein C0617_09400 [Desulfuromonas sp.]|uniref:hypothetical protein n=1 Tax=Desulfuromonas sp. TaxID=892 RepID=UPI000CC3A67B|nr:hypothetical protein [Desulfuromonas sp.]PLX84027.1 MAG: hypothetical protein C0617_09400 [Desulfuromonas sp.]
MTEKTHCQAPQEHELHLCELKAKPHKADIDKLFENPKFVCTNCGGRVNRAENLCSPKPIGPED